MGHKLIGAVCGVLLAMHGAHRVRHLAAGGGFKEVAGRAGLE